MNETMKTIHDLHSTHGNFTSRPVDDEIVKEILAACVRGANASNRQGYSIVVIRGEDRVKKILSCGASSPVAFVFCADFNRINDIGEYLGYQSDYDNLFDLMTAHTDAVIAAQTAVIAASSLGVSSLYTNSIHNADRKNLADLYRELDLPDRHIFPVTAVLFGYEDKGPDHRKGRLSDTGIVHYDRYKRLNEDQKEAIAQTVNDPDNHFGDKGACDTYLEFYYTKWTSVKPAEDYRRLDDMLYDKLGSFVHERCK